MSYKKVDGYEGLVKDERGVVLNTSTDEIKAPKLLVKRRKKNKKRLKI